MTPVADNLLVDGDAAFVRVDNKRPPNMLEPGVVSDARNKRFDNGQAGPRYGVGVQRWGFAGTNFVPSTATYNTLIPGLAVYYLTLVQGAVYWWLPDAQLAFPSSSALVLGPADPITGVKPILQTLTTGQMFTATGSTQLAIAAPVLNLNAAVHAQVLRLGTPLGYARFTAPDTTDNAVLVTGDFRDQAGEDQGYGRAWRITTGNVPVSIPMNGHDAWDTVRLIPVLNGVTMLRGNRNERHYFGTNGVGIQPQTVPADTFRQRTSNVAQLTIPSHGLVAGDHLTIIGVGGTGYNLQDVAITIVNANNISYPSVGPNEGSTADTSGTFLLTNGPGELTLNCVPAWNDGDLVQFNTATPGAAIYGTQPPAAGAQYYVKGRAGTIGQPAASVHVSLYQDAACTIPVFISVVNLPNGFFFLERQAVSPGPYGNGAPSLLMQGANAQTPFQTGFLSAPLNVAVTAVSAASIATAANHRLIPGDAVVVSGLTHSSSPLQNPAYAVPVGSNQVTFYDTQLHALAAANGAGNNTGLITLDIGAQTGSIVKTSASAVPMPPAREGIYFLQRLFLLNGVNNILISDPLDPLHYTPLASSLTGNLGENQQVTNFQPLGLDTLLINMPNFILALSGLSGASSGWLLREVTRQYGCLAPLASVHQGTDVWGFGRAGVISVTKTEFGELSGVDIPVSQPVPLYINMVDWPYAGQACGENWNNRTFFALPLKGQTGTRVNNGVLVFNSLNRFLSVSQEVVGGELQGEIVPSGDHGDAWEGLWSGANLQPVDFARLLVDGEERLTWVNANGTVAWFTDDFTDMGVDISDSLTPRAYFGGRTVLALIGIVNWDTFNPNINISIGSVVYNETEPVVSGLTYDRTKYLVAGKNDNDFSQPDRADYSMVPDSGLYTPGVPFDVHENITEKLRFRQRDRNPQLTIANTRGSCRINVVVMKAAGTGMTASRQT